MVVVYDFRAYCTPRLLRSFSQQAGDVVCQFQNFEGRMKKVSAGLCRVQDALLTFDLQLDAHLLTLENAKDFAHTCSAACELNSIEQMIKKRDKIIR